MVECETLTIKIPKPALAVIRLEADLEGHTIQEQVQINIVSDVKATCEALRLNDFLETNSLIESFKEVLEVKKW